LETQGLPTSNHDKAMKMYEKIELKGTYIKSIEDVKLLDFDM